MIEKKINWTILAGGEAKRMGGSDKGLIKFKDKPLIEHVIDTLKPQVKKLMISANRNKAEYKKYAAVISDERIGFQGPLAGVESSLRCSDTQWNGFSPCDSPFLPNNLVSKLTSELEHEVDVYVATVGSKLQPVFSVWNRKVLPSLTKYLDEGDRKITLFFDHCNTVYVDFSDVPEAFANLNTPEDLIGTRSTHDEKA